MAVDGIIASVTVRSANLTSQSVAFNRTNVNIDGDDIGDIGDDDGVDDGDSSGDDDDDDGDDENDIDIDELFDACTIIFCGAPSSGIAKPNANTNPKIKPITTLFFSLFFILLPPYFYFFI